MERITIVRAGASTIGLIRRRYSWTRRGTSPARLSRRRTASVSRRSCQGIGFCTSPA